MKDHSARIIADKRDEGSEEENGTYAELKIL